jgi:hypothetical protein
MDKDRAAQIIDWWVNKFYWKDACDDEEVWYQIENGEIVSYTMDNLKSIADG